MKIQHNVSLAPHTTFKIGGPAKYFVEVSSAQELQEAIAFAQTKNTTWFMLGNGSNLLVSDRGYNGLVIKNKINHILYETVQNNQAVFTVSSGVMLNELIFFTLEKGYTGLHHFAYIPGTVGGALYINAHYLKYFIGDLLLSGLVLDKNGKISTWSQADFKFSYDNSKLKTDGAFVLEAKFLLEKGNIALARQEIKAIVDRRKKYPTLSAGCVWQNISDKEMKSAGLKHHAIAYIIDNILGLKGAKKGGAQISVKHAAFIENLGKAKAQDVLYLIGLVNKNMKKRFGILLRLEIELLGFTKQELNKII